MILFKPLYPFVEQEYVLLLGPIHAGFSVSVIQAVANGVAGDMLLSPVVFITRAKTELLGQKSQCALKAEDQMYLCPWPCRVEG